MAQANRLNTAARDELVTLLLDCTSVTTSYALIVSRLPPQIRRRVPEADSARTRVIHLVNTCNDYPEGLAALLDAVRFLEGESIAMQALMQWPHVRPDTQPDAQPDTQPAGPSRTPRLMAVAAMAITFVVVMLWWQPWSPGQPPGQPQPKAELSAEAEAVTNDTQVVPASATSGDQATSESRTASTSEPVTKPTDEPATKLTDEPATKPDGKSATKPKSATKLTDQPAAKPDDKSASKSATKPVGKSASKSATKPDDKSASKSATKPDDKSASKSAGTIQTETHVGRLELGDNARVKAGNVEGASTKAIKAKTTVDSTTCGDGCTLEFGNVTER